MADLNADHGREWLALYTVRDPKRGAPVLADSLTLSYKVKDKPSGGKMALHFIGETGAADLSDEAYCYNSGKGRMYFTWEC